jgi:GTP1/Obg family GTP-binding protein
VPWLQSESKMFWVSGKPASGKSTLMKYIITSPETLEYLEEWKPNVRLLHHFFL